MKITGNIFANNYWLMKFAPLALALAAVVKSWESILLL